jgi:RimJ/RimL family protein N-acetyltransferase
MDIDASLGPRLSALRAEALQHATGYETLSWQIPTPEEHLEQAAELHKIFADSPQDAGIETQTLDADQLRRLEQALVDKGARCYTVTARHSDSHQLVALTEIAVDPDIPDWGFQALTAVRREHRGHRLGLLVKVAMLDMLADREPGLRHVYTGNAGANEHMIAINERLGYRTTSTSRSWELELGGS